MLNPTLLSAGSAVGFGPKGLAATLPGWFSLSWGLVSDGTYYFQSPENSRKLMDAWKKDDVIGFGINFETRRLFFTHNEKLIEPEADISTVPEAALYSTYPTFGMDHMTITP